MKLNPPPRIGQEVYYIDCDKNLLRAIVTRVHTESYLKDCPTGTYWEVIKGIQYIHVPDGTKYGDLKLPRGFEIDLEVKIAGAVKSIEHVPYNTVEKGKTKSDSLAGNCWVFT